MTATALPIRTPFLDPPLTRTLLESLSTEAGLLRVLTNGLPDLIYIKDDQCRYVFNNPAHLRFLGAKAPDDVLGKSVLDLFPGDLAEKFYVQEKQIIESGVPLIGLEEETCDHAGRRMWVSTTKVPLRDAEGNTIGLAGISRDITDRKSAEELLVHANNELAATQLQLADVTKMQLVGALAAGIVHDVKNPLSVISVGLELLERTLSTPEPIVEMAMRNMRIAVENANGVLKSLLEFCRPQNLDHQQLSICTPIERALSLLKFEITRRQVALKVSFAAELPPVRGDMLRVEQVMINLVLNALHAMPSGGTLSVEVAPGNWDGKSKGGLVAGEPVVNVTIQDTGPGIPQEHLTRVFDAFFTTKPPGEGTGLGLCIAKRIMELHGGTIRLTNCAQGGARAVLTFKAEGVSP